MASEKMIEALSIAESYRRRYDGRAMSSKVLPPMPERQSTLDRVREAQRFAASHTDRQVAAAFPDVVRRAVTRSHWDRIRPTEAAS
jgi:hypothetical protein